MANRDEMLINFQAMTGVEDIAMCIEILEQKNWDLASAVNSMLPQPDYHQPLPYATPTNISSSEGYVDLTSQSGSERAHPFLPLDHGPVVGDTPSSGPLVKLLVFFGTSTITLYLPPSSTVIQVKEQLQIKTRLHPRRQILKGWPGPSPISDEENISTLGLLPEASNTLTLEYAPPTDAPPSYSDAVGLSSSLEAIITGATPPAHSGPSSLQETISGAFSNSVMVGTSSSVATDSPALSVTVGENRDDEPIVVSSPSSSSHYSDAPETLSSDDEEAVVEAFDDAMFDDSATSSRKAMKEPLIPQGCMEPYEALQFFTHAFEARYGAMHPLFLIGSLSEAVREATSGTAASGTRKPMFIYLHHDASILSNIFCSQLLCSESIVNFLTSNFVCWAWDLTSHEARLKLLQMVEECFGKVAKTSVDEIRADHLPAILVVYKVKGTTDIKTIIQGQTDLDSLMSSLMVSYEDHNVHLEQEAQEDRERVQREYMIAEQNRAYHESLVADKEKARQREQEEKVKAEQERLEEEEKNTREEKREAMEVSVPDEPPADSAEKMCTLRIRYPDGSQNRRRFLATHQIQDLLNLLGAKGYLMDDYKILTSFPKRDVTEINPSDTMETAGLCPQETLFVEER